MDPNLTPAPLCPFCSSSVSLTDIFCPTCGKNLKEKPLSTSVWKQIGLYAVSILLPPLFIGWTIKYIKSTNPKTKQIGWISLSLTVISLIVALWLSIAVTKNIGQEVNTQLQQYQTIGF